MEVEARRLLSVTAQIADLVDIPDIFIYFCLRAGEREQAYEEAVAGVGLDRK